MLGLGTSVSKPLFAYSTGSAMWTPADTTTQMWHDAADSGSITIATGVSQWNDKSGNGRHLLQANATYQPTYVSGQYVDTTTSNTCLASNAYNIATPECITAVWSIVSFIAAYERYIGYTNLPAANDDSNSFLPAMRDNAQLGESTFATSPAGFYLPYNPTLGNKFLWSLSRNSGFSSIEKRVNGTSLGTSSVTVNTPIYKHGISTSFEPIPGGVRPSNIRIYELVYHNNADRDKVEGYLAWKWGLEGALDAGHPYKSAAPLV